VDVFSQPLGLCSFHVDAKQGFFLNGEPYNLHGVTRHQDRFDQGWALSAADHEEVSRESGVGTFAESSAGHSRT
jgi:beta-galactosidase